MLGRLYYARGDWLETQRHMRQAIVRFPESPAIHDAYVRMLLAQGGTRNFNEAREYLNALAKLSRDDPNTFELMVRLAIKTSTPEKVLPVVRSRVPKITDPKKQLADDKSVRMMTLFSSLLTELKDLDGAEKIYRQLVEGDPKRVFALAAFLGVHRDVQQCFDLLAAEYSNERVHDVLRVAVSVIRSRRSEIGDKFDANVEEWFERALRASPGEVALLLAKAEFLEVQQKFDAAIAIYSDLLRSPDVTGLRRAVLLNNLAYLIALSSPDARTPDVDALALVEEAVSIFGPTADILDTRAVVLTARKRYQEALADLELSLMDNPTAAKYFHQATAHLLAGQNGPAVASWEKAVELGLTPGELNQLEHPRYQEIKGKIEQLQAGSNAVTRVER
jgi:tetratricopeptide (TPR) repeat protein